MNRTSWDEAKKAKEFNKTVDYVIPTLGAIFTAASLFFYTSVQIVPALACGAVMGAGLKYCYGEPPVKNSEKIAEEKESENDKQKPDLQQHKTRGISLLCCKRLKTTTITATPETQGR